MASLVNLILAQIFAFAIVYFARNYLHYRSISLVTPIYNYANNIADWYKGIFSHDIVLQNSELQQKNLELQVKLNLFQGLEKENQDLRQLLGMSDRLNGSFLVARVIGWDGQVAIIDKGQKNMVFLGQAVLGAKGVFGQVIDVGFNSSKVSLVINPKTSVAVSNLGNLKSFAHGTSAGLEIDNIASGVKVKSGDKIFTSGLAGIYPEGYPYGVINLVFDNSAGNKVAKARPLVNLSELNNVMLYWSEFKLKPPYRRF